MANARQVFDKFLGSVKSEKFKPALDLLCLDAVVPENAEEEHPMVNGQILLECVTELASNMELQSDDVTILRGLCRGNSSVFLALCCHRLVVVKEHVFAAGSFLITSNILYELSMLLFISHFAPKILFINKTPKNVKPSSAITETTFHGFHGT